MPAKRKAKAAEPMPQSLPKSTSWGNHHVAFALALLAASVSVTYLSWSGPSGAQPAEAQTASGPACSVASFVVSEPCGTETFQGGSAECQSGLKLKQRAKLCTTKANFDRTMRTSCARYGGVKSIDYGTACATQKYGRADYTCIAPPGGTAASGSQTTCKTATEHQAEANRFCGSVSCAPVPSSLAVSWNPESPTTLERPPAGNAGKTVGKITVQNTSIEPVTVKTINVNLESTFETVQYASKVRIESFVKNSDGGGSTWTVASRAMPVGSRYTDTQFTDADVRDTVIPPNGSAVFNVIVDLHPGIRRDRTITMSMDPSDVVWIKGGTTSSDVQGLPLAPHTLGFYQADLATSWAGDTPEGTGVASAAQLVAKIQVKNIVESGAAAIVKALNIDLLHSTVSSTENPVTVAVYKESLSSTPIATKTFPVGTDFSLMKFTDEEFEDVSIEPNGSRMFLFTLDTRWVRAGQRIDVRMENSKDIVWTDGVTPLIHDIAIYNNGCYWNRKTFTYY